VIAQRYDRVEPRLTRNGKDIPVREAKLKGASLMLQLATAAEGPTALYGEIDGSEMTVRENDALNTKIAKARMTGVRSTAALP
jgi:hypothetical protein